MREISPSLHYSADEYLALQPDFIRQKVQIIREQKWKGLRPRPSTSLIDRSKLLTPMNRAAILDQIASLVDENVFGRSDMCMQFADLLQRSLNYLGQKAHGVLGIASYYAGQRKIFQWRHAWVYAGQEIVDGNVDSLFENPAIPQSVNVFPYWGPSKYIPQDRRLVPGQKLIFATHDPDIDDIWWPEMKNWLERNFSKH